MTLSNRLNGAARNTRLSAEPRDFPLALMVAGEASADLHGSTLVRAMKRLEPGLVFWGIGGPRMKQAGVKLFFTSSELAVVGLTEVFRKLRVITRAYFRLSEILRQNRPDLLILLDFPDFNLLLARVAKKWGVPVLYYISPQVWAWRTGRVKTIARVVDRMAVILPFEEVFYREQGVRVDYVGHPLLDSYPCLSPSSLSAARQDTSLPVLGLLPGSRREEIRHLLPVMLGAVERLQECYPEIRCLLPVAPTLDGEWVKSFVHGSSGNVTVVEGDMQETLRQAHLAFVASGTATLETAIMGVPMIILYKVSPLSYAIGKRVVHVPHIGLVNLIAGERVVPELIQAEATPENLAHKAVELLEDRGLRQQMIMALAKVRNALGSPGAAERTAQIALNTMRSE